MFKPGCIFILISAVLTTGLESDPDTPEQSKQVLAQAKGAILRADGPEALTLLSQLAEGELSSKDRAFLSCATDRLSGAGPALAQDISSPLVQEILTAFRAYWQGAITNRDDQDQAERKLDLRLAKILQVDDLDLVETTITERLQSEGLYVLMGRTGKLRELMIWRTQTEEKETVELPEAQVSANVIYLDDFISTGWSSYFGCNMIGTSGWATSDGLYVVTPRWDSLTGERFRISLLAHESQHFHDYSNFPDLTGWELEYRAKLVELALADADQNRLIERFTANQGSDKSDAHSYANRKVLADIRVHLNLPATNRLEFDSKLIIQQAADALLRLDSQNRQEQAEAG